MGSVVTNKKIDLLIGMSLIIAYVGSVSAIDRIPGIDPFIEEKEQGWFWYKSEPEPKEPEEVKKPIKKPEIKAEPQSIIVAPEKTTEKPPEVFSVDWFKTEYEKKLNAAIDNPTPENVREYRYATRVMLDKASNFTHEFQRQSLLDPLLDESNRYPFANASRGSFKRFTDQQRKSVIRSLKDKAGLWVFMDESCHFCQLQYPIIKRTAQDNGLLVQFITKDGLHPKWMDKKEEVLKDSGQSKYLKINVRPATALVIPPKKVVVLTQGMLSSDLMEERFLAAMGNEGLLDKKMRDLVYPNEKGLLTPQDIKRASSKIKDGGKMTDTVQELLIERGN